MTAPLDPINDVDLHAYVDDQLHVQRRIEVEAHLSRDPDAAARVMADLRHRGELRLALADLPRSGCVATTDAARRLERGIAQDRWMKRISQAAVLVVWLALGWLAHAQFGTIGSLSASTPPPAYVQNALSIYRAARAAPVEPSAKPYDPEAIRAATAIALPDLPSDWKVAAVAILPSAFGPKVELAIASSSLGNFALFATRPGTFDVVPPTMTNTGTGEPVAYWQIGDVAYVLIARAAPRDLERTAAGLAKTLY